MPRKILIVEDNEKNLKLFRVILNSLGYETISAKNGEEGVRTASENMPDLILMDIQMPVMDGVTAMGMLKRDERTKEIPVIAVTSYAMKGDRERMMEHGFKGYIPKPVDKDNFIKIVQDVLMREGV